jgi:very-short-patch-repair endonuclease
METVEIVEIFEINKLRDFVFYDCGLLHNNISNILDKKTELFLLVNEDLYQKYSENDFIISLDDIWYFLEYSQKARAKNVLEKHFILNVDYKIIKSQNEDYVSCKKSRGGHNKEKIVMTLKTYNLFCLKGDTIMSYKIQDYYVKLEQIVLKTINDEFCLFKKNTQSEGECVNIGMSVENQTIGFIENSFKGIFDTKRQFMFDKYNVDLYFSQHNLVIECDENNHDDRNETEEKIREEFILSLGNTIIRFNPNDIKFELSLVLREINKVLFSKQNTEIKLILLP